MLEVLLCYVVLHVLLCMRIWIIVLAKYMLGGRHHVHAAYAKEHSMCNTPAHTVLQGSFSRTIIFHNQPLWQ